MAKQSSTRAYKPDARQKRTQYPEEDFNKGMYYTNTPLESGYVKALINYDLKDDGASLVPRPGLRVNELALIDTAVNTPEYSENYVISTGRDCVEEDTLNYKQIIVGIPTTTKRAGTNLYLGDSYAWTVDNNIDNLEILDEINVKKFKSVTLAKNYLEVTTPKPGYIKEPAYFRRPEQAEIHGIPITDLSFMAKQVGTFAFNNSFYYFKRIKETVATGGTEGAHRGMLCRTKMDQATHVYQKEVVASKYEQKQLSPKEAVLWGYNMLQENPYTFANVSAAGVLQLLGILPYDADSSIIVSPKINQTIFLECFYAGNTANKYKVVWDWREPGASAWTPFKVEELTLTNLPHMKAEFSCPHKEVMVRITAFKWTGTAYEDVAEKVMTVGLAFSQENQKFEPPTDTEVKVYDLSTAYGMTYWKNRLVVYGVAKDPTIIFLSDINDPWYFPYPNNIDVFDEPVIHVTPFLDNLLVFTSTKLFLMTLSLDGLSWTKKMIQGNLTIKDWDIHLIQVVKNMVFFKSGNYYYMVVPKASSLTGELTVAPISKPVESIFDNFLEVVKEQVELLYNYKGTLQLMHYYNFLDLDDIHNIYVFQTEEGVFMNVDILYNTLLRMWRMHIYESQFLLHPYRQDATKKGTMMSLARLKYTNKVGEDPITLTTGAGIQFYQFNNLEIKDRYIPKDYHVSWAIPTNPTTQAYWGNLDADFLLIHKLFNYQLLDAGYREHATDYNKRYREVQIKFNNISQKTLLFNTEFSIDGDMRKSFYRYEMHQETDPADPNYGLIYLERIPVVSESLPGSTILAETATVGPNEVYTVVRDLDPASPTYGVISVADDVDPNADLGSWALDQSIFPETVLWKVRIPISGKGYAPKLRMLSFNEERYELLNVIWVFRMMSSR